MRVVVDLQGCQSPDGRIRGVGRYCLSLTTALARHARGHELWIAVNGVMPESVATIRDLFSGVLPAERIVSWESLAPTAHMWPENRERGVVAERLRENFLESIEPDVVLTASMIDGFVDSVVTSVPPRSRALQVAILFDLIPLAMPDVYLVKEGQSAWYMRKIDHLKRCDLLLGISASACDEAVRMIGASPERVVNISAAVSEDFRRLPGPLSASAVGRKHGIGKPFVMYAGGFDPRKNLVALVEAYAALPALVRAGHQLVMVGNIDTLEFDELTAAREAAGLAKDDLVFTGFVSDVELVRLYNTCALYVFPSIHEGFGLPALEAMSCGAVVIGASTTSLPEVIGTDEALFDPYSVPDITAKLLEGLTDESFRNRMREHAAGHVGNFSWASSAERAWGAIEAAAAQRTTVDLGATVGDSYADKKRVALLASSAMTAAQLAAAVGYEPHQVDVFYKGHSASLGDMPTGWRLHALGGFLPAAFDAIVVKVDDSADMPGLLRAVERCPALLAIGAAHLPTVFRALAEGDPALLAGMLYRWGGYRALDLLAAAAPSRFDALPSGVLAFGDPSWCVAGDDAMRQAACASFVAEVASLPGVARWPAPDIGRLAMAIAANHPPRTEQKALYVDISHLVTEDAKTGIQRVVRHIVAELMATPPEGYRVEPVYIQPDGVFRYARTYCVNRFHPSVTLPDDSPVDFRPGDTFVGLDLAAHLVPYLRDTYVRMRSRGVDIHFVVYDLLPLLRPDCFDQAGLPTFRLWYEAIAELADGIICISRTVADEFKRWLPQAMPMRGRPLRIGWFHLGADLVPTATPADVAGVVPFDLGGKPSFLMVGTIEPRKGHAQTVAAFDAIWARGHDVNLVLIGKPGWRVEALVSRLREHPEAGKRLFWLERADDTQLIAMYQTASALLAPSEGEGFGLPLIEAAQYGRPIIARDLPVFEEVAGKHAFYFSGMEPAAMADAIERWLALFARGEAPGSSDMPWLTWRESAQQLAEVAVGGRWYESWMPGALRHFVASDYRAEASVGELSRGRRQSSGTPGLLFGTPSIGMSAGEYEVHVLGTRTGPQGAAWVDVEARDGTWRLSSAHLTEGDGTIGRLEVRIPEDVRDLRVRVMVDGEAEITFASLDISPVA
jgi:glycosyltransferase involved in cell wall biosynthesis